MNVREFFFALPPELIAQEPPPSRGASRLLQLDRRTGQRNHTTVDHVADVLEPGDVVVVNNTRVFPARLLGQRVPSGGAVECLLVNRESPAAASGLGPASSGEIWEALMH